MILIMINRRFHVVQPRKMNAKDRICIEDGMFVNLLGLYSESVRLDFFQSYKGILIECATSHTNVVHI